eukprot:4481956-Prymnesium_polylepis.1
MSRALRRAPRAVIRSCGMRVANVASASLRWHVECKEALLWTVTWHVPPSYGTDHPNVARTTLIWQVEYDEPVLWELHFWAQSFDRDALEHNAR